MNKSNIKSIKELATAYNVCPQTFKNWLMQIDDKTILAKENNILLPYQVDNIIKYIGTETPSLTLSEIAINYKVSKPTLLKQLKPISKGLKLTRANKLHPTKIDKIVNFMENGII